MITENGLTAELDCVTACRPAYPGHDNSSVNPLLFTIHDIEDGQPTLSPSDTALMIGAAGSDDGIMGDAWLDKATTQASVHFGVYPGGVAQCLPLNLGCWGAGPSANSVAIQAEQSGVAAYTTAQWLTPAGVQQLNNMAQLYAELCVKFGWTPHWATDAEIQACVSGSVVGSQFGGATYHHDWTRNFPQDTKHTDPGANYPGKADGPYQPGQNDPQDQFMPLAIAKWQALTGATPTPAPTPGGSDIMQLDPKDKQDLLDAIKGDRDNTQIELRTQIAAEQGRLMTDNRAQIAALTAALSRFANSVAVGIAAIEAAPGVKK